jgi:putative protein-disulfide isomerase
MNAPLLWYFADPMCSWCWGFSPVINAIREHYRGHMKVALILGGLRPGTTVPMTPKEREEILHHWHAVHEKTGQPFRFEGALGEGFVYDTEPASRAVVAMADLDPDAVFPLFMAIQAAFYAEGRDVTRSEVLADLAEGLGADRTAFLAAFGSDAARAKTLAHFQMARRAGVAGFPTVVLQRGEQHRFLSRGYAPLAEIQPDIDAWLAGAEGASA